MITGKPNARHGAREDGGMGEAKRKRHDPRDTLDGGEPSDDRIVLMLDMFDPMQALLAMDDAARLTTVRECMARAHQRPTPLCSACEYEFGYGEPPASVYCTRPMFPKARPSPSSLV
jgi:hypothetical protein